MSQDIDLVADIREEQGKGASRRLRKDGMVPAIIYGAGRPARKITIDHNLLIRQLENESFYSSILNIKVGDNSQSAIVKDIQRHPSKRLIMHMDFQRIVADEKIKMNVPIHYLNVETAVGVKIGGGSVSQLRNDIEVICLPKDLPEYFEVDIQDLELDQMLHLSDIKVPDGVEIPELAQGPDHDHPIVSIQLIKVQEEPTEEETADGDEDSIDSDETPSDEDSGETETEKDN